MLPYDNEAALRYLDYVSVDISEGDTTYYHGTLSRIMENSRQVKLEDVAPGGGTRAFDVHQLRLYL